MALEKTDFALLAPRGSRGLWGALTARLLKKKVAVACLIVIGVLYGSGAFAPVVAPYSYRDPDLRNTLASPSLSHPLGTDRLGRDVLSRVIYGLRTTVIVTVASLVTGSLVLGILSGLVAGYLGGRVDALLMRIGEVFLAFPSLLLVILIAATVRPRVETLVRQLEDVTGIEGLVRLGLVDYLVVFSALALFSWVGMARLVRGQVLSLREREFITAAQALGASTPRILLSHLLPNALPPVIVTVSMGMGSVIGAEIVLSWLGIGVQPPNPSLGTMIFENQSIDVLRTDPHLLLAPVLVVATLIFAFNLLGDALNDVFNPRTR